MDEEPKKIAQVGAYVTLPFVLAVPPLVGAVIGRWLDGRLGTEPWLMYVMLAFGFAAGVREFWRVLKRFRDDR